MTSSPYSAQARVDAVGEHAQAFLDAHRTELRALDRGAWIDVSIPGEGAHLVDRTADRHSTYAAVVVAVRELAETGVRLALFPATDGVRLVRLNGGAR